MEEFWGEKFAALQKADDEETIKTVTQSDRLQAWGEMGNIDDLAQMYSLDPDDIAKWEVQKCYMLLLRKALKEEIAQRARKHQEKKNENT